MFKLKDWIDKDKIYWTQLLLLRKKQTLKNISIFSNIKDLF